MQHWKLIATPDVICFRIVGKVLLDGRNQKEMVRFHFSSMEIDYLGIFGVQMMVFTLVPLCLGVGGCRPSLNSLVSLYVYNYIRHLLT